jgi:hypothetical protein
MEGRDRRSVTTEQLLGAFVHQHAPRHQGSYGENLQLLRSKFTTDVLVRRWFNFVQHILEGVTDPALIANTDEVMVAVTDQGKLVTGRGHRAMLADLDSDGLPELPEDDEPDDTIAGADERGEGAAGDDEQPPVIPNAAIGELRRRGARLHL